MATLTKAWASGTGNVYLTFGGSGNGTIVVESDDNDLPTSRSMTLTVKTTSGSPQQTKSVTVSQAAGPNFRLKNGTAFVTKGSDFFNVKT